MRVIVLLRYSLVRKCIHQNTIKCYHFSFIFVLSKILKMFRFLDSPNLKLTHNVNNMYKVGYINIGQMLDKPLNASFSLVVSKCDVCMINVIGHTWRRPRKYVLKSCIFSFKVNIVKYVEVEGKDNNTISVQVGKQNQHLTEHSI